MSPYGNEHSYKIDDLNSTKHRPNRPSKLRQASRRLAKKTRRACDKAALRVADRIDGYDRDDIGLSADY